MSWRERVAHLEIEADGKRFVGTGFWLTRDRILTAGHVVEGASRLRIRTVTGGEILVSAEAIKWTGGDTVDAALVAAEYPGNVSWCERSFVRPIDRNQSCACMGFARVSRETPLDDSVAGERFELSGTLHPPLADRPTLQFSVEQRVHQITKLAGISGAPVMVGEHLHGVLSGGPEDLDGGILHVVSVHALILDSKFFEALALPPVEDRCHALRTGVDRFMIRNEEFGRRFWRSSSLEMPQEVANGENGSARLEWIFAKFRTREMLEFFFDLQGEDWARPELLEELLMLLVPLCYWGELDRKKAQISDDFMRLPVVEPAFAEIIQAAYDDHAVEFLRLPEDPLRSPRAIEAPRRPAAGGSPTLENAELVDHLLQDLLGRSFKGDSFLSIDRFQKTESMPEPERFEQRRFIINDLLKKQRDRFKRIFFLLVDKETLANYGPSGEAFLRRVRELLPPLRIVVLDGSNDKYGEETMALEDLRTILLRRRERLAQ